MEATSTIAAIASPPGPGRRGVIRVSGPAAAALVRRTWRGLAGTEPDLGGRVLAEGRFHDGRGEQPCLLLWMPGPHSYTREDVAELHLPGAPPLLGAALERLLALGAEPAAPGEFTRRAFLSGRIDLTRAEGVLSLVHATSRGEARAAVALLRGGLAERVDALRERLVELRSLCEASLDFDEADTGHVPDEELGARCEELASELGAALAWEERRVPAAGEPRIALAGAANAGKSSLFNALTGAPARGGTPVAPDAPGGSGALVHELAGTTRDAVAGRWIVAGVGCRLTDTAGLLDGAVGPDEAAQELGREEHEGADLLLWVVDGTRADAGLSAERERLPGDAPRILVWSKADRPTHRAAPPEEFAAGSPWVAVSVRTRVGLEALERRAARALGLSAEGSAGEGPPGDPVGDPAGGLSRELSARHRRALRASLEELEAGRSAWRDGAPLELLAERLRSATDELDGITGRTRIDDVLDLVFSRFCIGK